MSAVKNVFLIIHILAVIGGLVLLLTALPKPTKSIPAGFLHSMLTALVTGIALVGINTSLHASDAVKYEAPDHGVVGIKFLVLLVILVITIMNKKKAEVSTGLWAGLIALTLANVFIATSLEFT
jgi:thiamine transporter ThiT